MNRTTAVALRVSRSIATAGMTPTTTASSATNPILQGVNVTATNQEGACGMSSCAATPARHNPPPNYRQGGANMTTGRFCARCGLGLFMQSKHYFEEADGALTCYCLPCGVKRERREARKAKSVQ